jgi:hypothetical protein
MPPCGSFGMTEHCGSVGPFNSMSCVSVLQKKLASLVDRKPRTAEHYASVVVRGWIHTA